MPRWFCAAAMAALVLVSAPSAVAQQRARDRLDVYTAVVQRDQADSLSARGYDITGARETAAGLELQLILTKGQRAKLAGDGIKTELTRVQGGLTVKEFAAQQSQFGFNVWRSYDEPGGMRDQMYAVARNNPQVAKIEKIGTTLQGREILALKLTQSAREVPDGSRPAVLYSALQHAREWIAGEVDRRLMNWYVDRWRANDKAVKDLLKKTELWFVLVANPDGYEYTFTTERLWRKNLRDNDGDGQTTIVDGVDPNRNYPNHFKYDEEGSSKIFSSQTYRGPGPVSERETAALKG